MGRSQIPDRLRDSYTGKRLDRYVANSDDTLVMDRTRYGSRGSAGRVILVARGSAGSIANQLSRTSRPLSFVPLVALVVVASALVIAMVAVQHSTPWSTALLILAVLAAILVIDVIVVIKVNAALRTKDSRADLDSRTRLGIDVSEDLAWDDVSDDLPAEDRRTVVDAIDSATDTQGEVSRQGDRVSFWQRKIWARRQEDHERAIREHLAESYQRKSRDRPTFNFHDTRGR